MNKNWSQSITANAVDMEIKSNFMEICTTSKHASWITLDLPAIRAPKWKMIAKSNVLQDDGDKSSAGCVNLINWINILRNPFLCERELQIDENFQQRISVKINEHIHPNVVIVQLSSKCVMHSFKSFELQIAQSDFSTILQLQGKKGSQMWWDLISNNAPNNWQQF